MGAAAYPGGPSSVGAVLESGASTGSASSASTISLTYLKTSPWQVEQPTPSLSIFLLKLVWDLSYKEGICPAARI